MNLIRRFIILITLIVCFDIIFGQSRLNDIALYDIREQPVSLQLINKYKATVFFFLSPDCPLCENYSLTISNLRREFSENAVSFIGIFPGKYYEKIEIQSFMGKYHPPVKVLLDPDLSLTCFLGANVTPEAFVVNDQGKILYQGKIDNWIAALGKHRTVTTRFFLRDALIAILAGKPVTVSQTEAIGCLIE
ncbi:MAG: redoxin family protein [Bacteroidia bacterium]